MEVITMKSRTRRALCMILLVCLFAAMTGSPAAADSGSLSVDKLYDMKNTDGYSLKNDNFKADWVLVTGHVYGMELSGASDSLVYKSNKKAVAAVDANGVITCKKAGNAIITITDNGTGQSCKITLKVRKNENSVKSYGWGGYEDDDGVYVSTKKIYTKGTTLHVELYVINYRDGASYVQGPAELFLATPLKYARRLYAKDFKSLGMVNMKKTIIKKYATHKVLKFKIENVDPQVLYLVNAEAYLKSEYIEGYISLYDIFD